ncbi:MoxR family ATPase [uncultured Lutibacter sp.]|uniref:AAA family ATPase n=1 Tax=uncultured Lutibacter sp. TaxID=437739 RepID=UPI00262320E4|nr:MoxR family ATPase [uncultured Lutibacter sp.]
MANKALEIIDLLDELRNNNLYVHNDELAKISFNIEALKDRPVYLVETLATINALVKKGTMLLYGGHGGGKTTLSKYLGQMFLGKTSNEIEQAILRGHPQLTEEKILGSLNLEQLMGQKKIKDGNIEVQWNDFVKSQWKIIDEVNRLSHYAQNILLSLLAEGVVKYQNQSYPVGNFTVFATMNPPDEGNVNLPMPFLDRFALALPITMPDYLSMQTIGKKDKLNNKSTFDLRLQNNDLDLIQDLIQDSIEYEPEAEEFINNIIADYRLCIRLTKEASEDLTVDNGLCTNGGECRYFVEGQICNKTRNPLSVRVKEDLYRYGRAFAWLLGYEKVNSIHIKTIAPYLIWHRSNLSKKFLKENIKSKFEDKVFSVNAELEGTKTIINQIHTRFEYRYQNFIKPFNNALKSKLAPADFTELINKSKEVEDDLLIVMELLPELQNLEGYYNKMLGYQKDIDSTNDIKKLNTISLKLKREYKIRNRQLLTNKIEIKILKLKTEKHRQIKIEIVDSINVSKSEILTNLFAPIYGQSLDFTQSIGKNITISKVSDEFNLEVKHFRNGNNVKLICNYQGPDNDIKKELLKIGTETV